METLRYTDCWLWIFSRTLVMDVSSCSESTWRDKCRINVEILHVSTKNIDSENVSIFGRSPWDCVHCALVCALVYNSQMYSSLCVSLSPPLLQRGELWVEEVDGGFGEATAQTTRCWGQESLRWGTLLSLFTLVYFAVVDSQRDDYCWELQRVVTDQSWRERYDRALLNLGIVSS